jgi:CRISPR-associated protein Cas6
MNSSSLGMAIAREGEEPHVTVGFPLQAKQLPADHGYLLYSAISRLTDRGSSPTVREGSSSGKGVPPVRDGEYRTVSDSKRVVTRSAGILTARLPLHKADWLAIELISGFPSGPGLITLWSQQNSKLETRNSKLSLRIPADHYREVLRLAGKRLDIGGHQIRLGLPVARPLGPARSLYARVVTIKKFTEAEPFIEAVKRKLDSFGVKGRVELPRYRRRIVTIHGKSVVGFSVFVIKSGLYEVKSTPVGITESRDFSQLTFHNHNPIAQRLLRPNQNTATSNVESTRKCMWDGEWDRE